MRLYSYEIGSKLSLTTLGIGKRVFARHINGPLKIVAPYDSRKIEPGQGPLNLKVNEEGKLETGSSIPDISDIKEKHL